MNTSGTKGQSSLPSLGRARPGQPAPLTGAADRATLPFGSTERKPAVDGMLPPSASLPGQRTQADQQDMLEAELQALRHPKSDTAGEGRSWSYLATEGGKGSGRRR